MNRELSYLSLSCPTTGFPLCLCRACPLLLKCLLAGGPPFTETFAPRCCWLRAESHPSPSTAAISRKATGWELVLIQNHEFYATAFKWFATKRIKCFSIPYMYSKQCFFSSVSGLVKYSCVYVYYFINSIHFSCARFCRLRSRGWRTRFRRCTETWQNITLSSTRTLWMRSWKGLYSLTNRSRLSTLLCRPRGPYLRRWG